MPCVLRETSEFSGGIEVPEVDALGSKLYVSRPMNAFHINPGIPIREIFDEPLCSQRITPL